MSKVKKELLTPEKTKEICEEILALGEAHFYDKDKNYFKWAAHAVDVFTDITYDQFIDDYTQTVYDRVYPCDDFFKRGWGAILTTTHELRHVFQYREDIFMPLKYMQNQAERARLEGQARYCNSYMIFWDSGKWPSAKAQAAFIKPYGITDSSLVATESQLYMDFLSTDELGEPLEPWLNDIIDILEKHGVVEK